MADRQTIQALSDAIVQGFAPDQVILFGSHARGDITRDSDVDLLVVFHVVENTHRTAVEIRRALKNFPVPKDILVTTRDEIVRRKSMPGDVIRNAVRDGEVLYGQ